MLNYTGAKCPICEKPFREDDDIVVCPTCGAPYHRDCYKEAGSCIYEELHEKGQRWEAPEPEERPVTSTAHEIKDQECPRCSVLNGHSALFCSSCGSPLKIEPDTHNNSQYTQNTGFPPMYGMPIPFDPMGGVKPTDTMDEHISYGEVSKVVQQNTRYYMPVFDKIKKTKRGKFNFCAFLFSGGWFLYRKQYKKGILFSVLMLALYLGQTFTTLFVSYPKIVELLEKAGKDVTQSSISIEQVMSISSTITTPDLLLIALPTIISFAMLAVMIVLGFLGNRMYMKHCVRTINKIRNTTVNSEDFNTRIMEKGGINTTAALCVLICYFLCTWMPKFFLF